MNLRATTTVALAAVGVTVAGCGSSSSSAPGHAAKSASSIQVTQAPAVNEVALSSGSDESQITGTIQAFYRATWHNQGAAACSLFSPSGLSGFLSAAKIAFPDSVSSVTTCPQAMAFFNADLADSVDTIQQAGVSVSGNILDKVGVDHIQIHGAQATAVAPEGVDVFVKPKLFTLVRINDRWLIQSSSKIGKTLPQILAAAKASGQLTPKSHKR